LHVRRVGDDFSNFRDIWVLRQLRKWIFFVILLFSKRTLIHLFIPRSNKVLCCFSLLLLLIFDWKHISLCKITSGLLIFGPSEPLTGSRRLWPSDYCNFEQNIFVIRTSFISFLEIFSESEIVLVSTIIRYNWFLKYFEWRG
jgi:hypothetical protein